MPISLTQYEQGELRCSWCGNFPDYIHYHDHEWGMPMADDRRLFEKITLEGFQSGLSWLTILRKRQAFRDAFVGFDFEKIARFDEADVARLLSNVGIVRHRGKITSAINNAMRACELVEQYGSLASYFWRYEPPAHERPKRITPEVLTSLTQSTESLTLSKDLKKRGFSFVGPTTLYAFMQSMGIVNDHLEGCDARVRVEAARSVFKRPV
jgi:DNA-3-methyladenine glycosylase I